MLPEDLERVDNNLLLYLDVNEGHTLGIDCCVYLFLGYTRCGYEVIDSSIPALIPFEGYDDCPSRPPTDQLRSEKLVIVPWDSFFSEARAWDATRFLVQRVSMPLWTSNTIPKRTFHERDVSRVVSPILEVVAYMSRCSLVAEGTKLSGKRTADGGMARVHPDFTFHNASGKSIAVVEIKQPLLGPNDALRTAASAFKPNSQQCTDEWAKQVFAFSTLEQLRSYLIGGVHIGVISDSQFYWFVQSDGDRLRVSDALPCQHRTPTVLRALGYALSLSLEAEGVEESPSKGKAESQGALPRC